MFYTDTPVMLQPSMTQEKGYPLLSFWGEDINYFEKSAESFKHQHSPKIEELKKYLDELYEAMRKDLGSNK